MFYFILYNACNASCPTPVVTDTVVAIQKAFPFFHFAHLPQSWKSTTLRAGKPDVDFIVLKWIRCQCRCHFCKHAHAPFVLPIIHTLPPANPPILLGMVWKMGRKLSFTPFSPQRFLSRHVFWLLRIVFFLSRFNIYVLFLPHTELLYIPFYPERTMWPNILIILHLDRDT